MNLHKVCLTALALALSATSFAAPASAARQKCDRHNLIESDVTVDRGVDGDTVMVKAVSGVYSVRMLGIDTPETHYLGKSQGEWGEKAAARLKRILPVGTPVTLEFSEEGCDKYGRVLAFVFKDGKNINAQMAKEGLAVSYCYGPDIKHCDEIGGYVNDAIAKGKGMFSDPSLELPYDWRRRMSDRGWEVYVGNLRTKEVFAPGSNDRVPVGDRVFFMNRYDIHAPFQLVE